MATNSASVKTAVRITRASQKAYARKWSFLVVFCYILFVTVGAAAKLDVLPNPQQKKVVSIDPSSIPASPVEAATSPELPTKVEIPAIGLSQKVSNPDTTDVAKLDNALLSGPVRYPASSNLGEAGNVIIFGHSSYLPIVHNQAFKAFDGIQKLKAGDLITVTGQSHVYTYAVESVETEDATVDAIPLTVVGSKLTLATCDSFGSKSDRFVVTATLVNTKSL